MMRIYYVVNARMPNEKAHGIQIAKTCESFIEAGAQVTLVVPNRKHDPQSMREYYQLRHDVEIVYLPSLDWYTSGRILFALSSFTFMVSYLWYLGLRVMHKEHFVLYSVDVDTFSATALTFLPRPFFSELHGKRTSHLVTRRFFRGVDGIIAINEFVARAVRETFNVSMERVLIEPNGVDVGQFEVSENKETLRAELNIPRGPCVLYVGRFYGWKHLEILVQAATQAPDILWCVVGGTHDEFLAMADVPSVPPNVVFCGSQASHQIPRYLAAADALLVLGSNTDEASRYFTSPMKIFEYLASGRPIVASGTPAIQQVLDSECSYLYTPDDAHDLVRAARAALTEDTVMLCMRAKERAHSHAWERRAGRILEFISRYTAS